MTRSSGRRPALLGVLLLVAACEASAPSVAPTATPIPTPAPVFTSLPTGSANPATIAIPAGELRTLPGIVPWAVTGSIVYGVRADGSAAPASVAIEAGDLATGQTTVLATTEPGHAVAAIAGNEALAAWVETWRDPAPALLNATSSAQVATTPGCADVGRPLEWRIWTIVPGASPTFVTNGVNVRTAVGGECADVNPPLLALSGNRLAYTREASTVADPLANLIVIRSVTTTGSSREIATHGLVRDLHLSGTAVAYRECVPLVGADTVDAIDCRVMATSTDDQPAGLVDGHATALALGGSRLAWASFVPADGSIVTTVLGSGQIARVPAPRGAGLVVDGSALPAASDGLVAWLVDRTASDGTNTSALAVWLAGDAPARFVRGHSPLDFVAADDTWLVWSDDTGQAGGAPAGLHGVTITALAKAAR